MTEYQTDTPNQAKETTDTYTYLWIDQKTQRKKRKPTRKRGKKKKSKYN